MAEREMTYSDLQVRVLEDVVTPETEEAVLVAVTVANTGGVDDVERVHLFVLPEQGGLVPTLVATTDEQLETDHSHRVRHTLTGADLARAGDGGAPGITGRYRIAAGPSATDLRVEATIDLG